MNTNTFIIIYDLSLPSVNYIRLTQLIQKFPGWAKIGQSAYIITTTLDDVKVRDSLLPALGPKDKLFVAKISSPAAWFNLDIQVSNWIKTNLK